MSTAVPAGVTPGSPTLQLMSLESVALLLAVWVLGSIPLALFLGRALRLLTQDDQTWLLPSTSPWRTTVAGTQSELPLAS
jgi:hypothetical protein